MLERRYLAIRLRKKNYTFLDLGTGNRYLLFRLREGESKDRDKEQGEDSQKGKG